jgi:hypothetical protein
VYVVPAIMVAIRLIVMDCMGRMVMRFEIEVRVLWMVGVGRVSVDVVSLVLVIRAWSVSTRSVDVEVKI